MGTGVRNRVMYPIDRVTVLGSVSGRCGRAWGARRTLAQMRECAVALVLCGCGFSSEATGSDANVEIDGSVVIDATAIDTMAIDGRPDPYCAGTLNRVCVDPPPSAAVTLPAGTLDTGNSLMCVPYTSTPA